MNRKLSAALVLSATLFSLPVHATLLVYEGFDYATGSQTDLAGGTGFSGTWASATITSPSMSYSTLTTTGNKTQNASGYDSTRFFNSVYGLSDQTIWISFISSMTGDQGGAITLTNSDYSTNTTVGSSWWSQSTWGMYIGGDSVPATWGSSAVATTSSTYFVMRIDFSATGSDNFYLWTNPALGSEPSIGSAAVSLTSDLTIAGLRLQSYNGQSLAFDEFRLGTTFADVSPNGVPEPGTASLLGLGLVGTLWMNRRRKSAR